MRDITFFLILVTLVPISLRSVHVGVILWIWTALIAPNEMMFGFMAPVPFGKIIAIVTLVIVFLSKENKRFYFDGLVALLLCFTISGSISAWTSIGDFSDNASIYDKFLKELVLAYVITICMGTRHRIHMVVLSIALAMGFIIADEGLQLIVTGGTHQAIGKASIGDNNHLAVAILMTGPLFAYLAKYAAPRYAKIAFIVMVILTVAATVSTNSRGGFVGLVILASFFVASSRKKAATIAIVIVAAGLFYAAAPAKYFARVDTINEADQDTSFMNRVVAWKISTLIALDRPLFGGGFHAVQQGPVWATYTPYFNRLDFIETPQPMPFAIAAHSIYFEILGDLGFVGFSLFLAILGTCFVKIRSIKRMTAKIPALKWAGDLAAMLQISLVVYCVAGAAVSLGYFEFMYMLVALVSVTHHVVRQDLTEMTKATNRQELQRRMGVRTIDTGVSPDQALAIRLLR